MIEFTLQPGKGKVTTLQHYLICVCTRVRACASSFITFRINPISIA